ncbi:MAG TPA: hypothetical protein DEQ47_06655, partial [Solibacterales bacterium]|nr:hypothetical protein [Bryobacterales bacterium]
TARLNFPEPPAARIRLLWQRMSTNASFFEAVSVAAGSLRSSKLRSFLTLLGVILATATLITVMSVIEGMDRYIAEHISDDLGADSFVIARIVMVGQWDPKKYMQMLRRNPELNEEEFRFLRENAKLSREIGLEDDRNAVAHYESQRIERVDLVGATSNIGLIGNYTALTGHFPLD